jgi:hypothetical protein
LTTAVYTAALNWIRWYWRVVEFVLGSGGNRRYSETPEEEKSVG